MHRERFVRARGLELEGKVEEARAGQSRLEREVKRAEQAVLRLAMREDLGDTLSTMNQHLGGLRADLSGVLQDENIALCQLRQLEAVDDAAGLTRQHVDAVQYLWEQGAREELAAVVGMVVDYVDLRLDGRSMIYLKGVMKTRVKPRMGGFEPPTF